MTTSQQAYEAINTLISYWVERGMKTINQEIIHNEELVNRIKPYIKMINAELNWKIEKSDTHTTLDFMWDGQTWSWKCSKCGNRQDYNSHCIACGRQSITLANGKNNYSLIN